MNNDIKNFKKRLLYRSQYRGSKEMDKLIGSFVRDYIDNFNYNELEELETFLNIDDDILYKIYNNELDEKNLNKLKIINLFKSYKF
tara:strand:+ start:9627 stop:9884 length:258 start_codon:yes stop_codon:yes gene_type:complete